MDKDLMLQLKQIVIKTCNVKNCTVEDIVESDAMIGSLGKLRLDSLDAVEIVMALDRNFGIKVENPGDARKILKSFVALEEFVRNNRKK